MKKLFSIFATFAMLCAVGCEEQGGGDDVNPNDKTEQPNEKPDDDGKEDVIPEDAYIALNKDGKWGYADKNGEIVIAPTYEVALPFADKVNGLALVAVKDESFEFPNYSATYHYINKNLLIQNLYFYLIFYSYIHQQIPIQFLVIN